MFCSIEDAWGEKSFTDKQIFKQSDKPEHFENKQDKEHLYSKYMELKEMFGNQDQDEPSIVEHFGDQVTKQVPVHRSNAGSGIVYQNKVCDAVEAHMAKCAHCRHKYGFGSGSRYRSKEHQGFSLDFSNLSFGIKSNKDIVTIFLFGLLVILLLQLFSK